MVTSFMRKKRPLLLIAILAGVGLLSAFLLIPRGTPAASPIPFPNTAVPTIEPIKTTAQPASTATHEPTLTATPTPTPVPPTITPSPTNPPWLDDPGERVLHAVLKKGREDVEPSVSEESLPFEEELLKLMNVERAKAGAPPLTMAPLLQKVAKDHSDDMAFNNFFGHKSQNGQNFVDRIREIGYGFSAAAENLFAGNGPYNSPEYVLKVWLNSPSHHDNMLNPIYTEVGIGYRYNPASTYGGYFTADFACP